MALSHLHSSAARTRGLLPQPVCRPRESRPYVIPQRAAVAPPARRFVCPESIGMLCWNCEGGMEFLVLLFVSLMLAVLIVLSRGGR